MRRTTFLLVFFLVSLGGVNSSSADRCQLPEALKKEISRYQGFVDKVIQTATKGAYAGKLFDDLAAFVDTFGHRLAGSENLENSITFLQNRTASTGLKVRKQPVEVPYWIRGKESAQLVSPRVKDLKIMGLGTSVGTNGSGITADVVVVSTFDELKKVEKEIPGKIVLFNGLYTSYGATVKYRTAGPAAASKLGAVAALVRSITPFSIYSPHTGSTSFGKEKPIPAACVTLEDADMMARMYKAGQKITVTLRMEARMAGNRTSNNLIFDLQGASLPDHYVTVSGHIDSWDVGQGALDDGGGAFLGLHSLLLLKSMNVPRPKRTIRGIMWTAEEEGLIGAYAYLAKYKDELKNWTAALESDSGLFTPLGISIRGTDQAYCIMKEILSLFKKLNATTVEKSSSVGSDISVFASSGVPLIEPLHVNNNYMWFHHTDGDSMRTLDSSVVDQNLALFSATCYILADLSVPLPRDVRGVSGVLTGNKSYNFQSPNSLSSDLQKLHNVNSDFERQPALF